MQSDNANTTHSPAGQTADGQPPADGQPAQPATAAFNPADSFEPITEEDFIAVLFGLRGSVTYEEIFGDATAPPTVPRSLEEVLRELEYAEFSVALQAAYDATFGRPTTAQAAAADNSSESASASETQTAAAQDPDQPMDEDPTVSTGQ